MGKSSGSIARARDSHSRARSDSPSPLGSDWSGRGFFDYRGNVWEVRGGYTQVGERFNAEVGFVFQAFNLLDHLSVVENVALPAYFGDGPSPAAQRGKRPSTTPVSSTAHFLSLDRPQELRDLMCVLRRAGHRPEAPGRLNPTSCASHV